MGELERWPRGLVPSAAPRAPPGVLLPVGASGAPPSPASRSWGGQPVPSSGGVGAAFCRCEGRLVSGRPSSGRPPLGAGAASRARCPCVLGGVGGPTACALGSWRCVPRGCRGGAPREAAVCRCGGCPSPGARPPAEACPPGALSASADHLLWARHAGVGFQHRPFGCLHALRGAACRGGGGRPFQGGSPFTVLRGFWRQALSLSRPPVPWGGQPGFRDPCFPGAVGVGVGTQHWPHSVLSCEPSLHPVGAAGERPRGGAALRRCEGRLSSGSLPPPAARPQGGLSSSATQVLWARLCGRGCPALSF